MQIIDSTENRKIKRLISLKQKKVRLKENLFLIEGIKSVGEAIAMGVSLSSILISESFSDKNREFVKKLKKTGYPLYLTRDIIFAKCSSLKTAQGILASLDMRYSSIGEIIKSLKPIIILDKINDPGNLGTIIRTADAFDLGGILLLPDCADSYNPKTVQASMGSILRVDIAGISYRDLDILIENGYSVFGMDLKGIELSFNEFSKGKTAVVIGSESHGISEAAKEKCKKLLKIPIPGRAESLNAAVAAGIIMNKISRI